MFYHPIASQILAAEHRADLEYKLRHLQSRSDLEIHRRRRRLRRRHLSEQ